MLILQMTGLSGSGKSTLAALLKSALELRGQPCEIIDGDAYRKTLCADLGFSENDRKENIRRLGIIAASFANRNIIAIIAAINPYEIVRSELRTRYGAKTIWVRCEKDILIQRDTRGLYRRALLPDKDPEKIYNLSGINDVYEQPAAPDCIVDTTAGLPDISAGKLITFTLQLLA